MKGKLPIIIHVIAVLFVIPCYLIGLLFHIVGSTFKTFGYLFQFDLDAAAELWMDLYDDVMNLRF